MMVAVHDFTPFPDSEHAWAGRTKDRRVTAPRHERSIGGHQESRSDARRSRSARPMTKRREGPSQLVELFLSVAEDLGATSDRDVAALAGVSVENVAHWRSGVSQEFKVQKLAAIRQALRARIGALRERAGAAGTRAGALAAIEIEDSGSPT